MEAGRPTYEGPDTRTWVLQTGDSSGGALHEQRVEYRPGSAFPPMHLHPAQDEHFEVEQGAMLFVIAGEQRRVEAGETIDIPRAIAHQARNASDREPALVRWETRPALRSSEFFAAAARLSGGPLRAARLADEYRDVFRVTGVTGVAVTVLGPVARVLGVPLPGGQPPRPRR
jgi:mannose-6-phosphate isomerase-like protein (cupin superfamily)